MEIQRTRTRHSRKRINNFESPTKNIATRRKEIFSRCETGRFRSFERENRSFDWNNKRRFTEESIVLKICLFDGNPVGEILRRTIDRLAIDLPIDLLKIRTISRAASEQSDLSRRIDALKLHLRITHRRNDTSEHNHE